MENSKPTQAERILRILQAMGSVTNAYLNDHVCFRYGARIHELRKDGHVIRTQRIKEGLFCFVYEGKRGEYAPVAPRSRPKRAKPDVELNQLSLV